MDITPLARIILEGRSRKSDRWADPEVARATQEGVLRSLLRRAADTEFGRRNDFRGLLAEKNVAAAYRRKVASCEYEDIRADVMRMINGESDVLWPGRCLNYAQSSGTSGGRSKYIPITDDSLQRCHYRGASYTVAHYLRRNPESHMFAGKGFILGGSFASELKPENPRVRIGDLSATLIDRINPLAGLFRIPSKRIALMPDWEEKLPALVEASASANVTNISGVPSWFLTVIKEVMKKRGIDKISDAWPNLEVFFHGGISFAPYREIYSSITDPKKMHFMENYNASEGFFAAQDRLDEPGMLLVLDNDIFYEFLDVDDPLAEPIGAWEAKEGKVYEMMISSSNGLWRYRLGDTVRVETINPLRISVAGRTKCFINAFGEEVMEENAEHAIAEACRETGAAVRNYTAAPVFADSARRGRHQWLIEWERKPSDIGQFAEILDAALRRVNSDYDAKRSHTIFLDGPEIISVPAGTFDRWLASIGNRKLGGQRKVPRLANDRKIADQLLSLINN